MSSNAFEIILLKKTSAYHVYVSNAMSETSAPLVVGQYRWDYCHWLAEIERSLNDWLGATVLNLGGHILRLRNVSSRTLSSPARAPLCAHIYA